VKSAALSRSGALSEMRRRTAREKSGVTARWETTHQPHGRIQLAFSSSLRLFPAWYSWKVWED
jgi:hypothetical protein